MMMLVAISGLAMVFAKGSLVPIFFSIMTDMLDIILERTKVAGQTRGVIPHLVETCLSIPRYADNTIFF